MYRTLALDITNHLRYRVFRRYRNHHMYVIRHQMPFLNPALLLQRQLAKNFSKVLPQMPVQRLSPTLRNKIPRGICTPILGGLGFHIRPSNNFLSCAWRLTIGSFLDGLPYMSNLCGLPGRAGGTPNLLGTLPTKKLALFAKLVGFPILNQEG